MEGILCRLQNPLIIANVFWMHAASQILSFTWDSVSICNSVFLVGKKIEAEKG